MTRPTSFGPPRPADQLEPFTGMKLKLNALSGMVSVGVASPHRRLDGRLPADGRRHRELSCWPVTA